MAVPTRTTSDPNAAADINELQRQITLGGDVTAKIADYPVTDTDGITHILMTTGASNRTVTLPTAADNTGRKLAVTKIDSGVGYVIVDGEGAETINGVASITVELQFSGIIVQCTGSAWIVVGTIGECHIQSIGSNIELVYTKILTGSITSTGFTFAHGVADARNKIIGAIFLPLDSASRYAAYPIDSDAIYITYDDTNINVIANAYWTSTGTYILTIKYYI